MANVCVAHCGIDIVFISNLIVSFAVSESHKNIVSGFIRMMLSSPGFVMSLFSLSHSPSLLSRLSLSLCSEEFPAVEETRPVTKR